jgi:tRNA-splicing ligase RtcB (3'-phosphate/5'-hydroxy nucleic acid ligase)
MIELKGKYNKNCKIFIDDVEPEALSQIQEILDQQISENIPVRIMVDVHKGNGICIGFTMPLTNILNPAHIGVDIGCGLLSARFSSKYNLNLAEIDTIIRKKIPMGFNTNEHSVIRDFPFEEVQISANKFINLYNKKFGTSYDAPTYDEKWLTNKLKEIKMDEKVFWKSLSSLGGGNHFIELGIDSNSNYWITVHSGSRNFGLKIADYWTNVAKRQLTVTPDEYNRRLNEITDKTPEKKDIPKRIAELKKEFSMGIDKEYLQGDNMIGYLFDMIFAQKYAEVNRTLMIDTIKKAIGIKSFDDVISSVHNYIDMNDMIIRKGAIASYEGQKMVIPLNMRDGMIIAEGKSNEDWNYSAPHGAGRLMSRGKAKQTVDLEKFQRSMKGIYSTSVCKETLDESPMVYKNSEMIEELIKPTVTVLDKVKPILNIKDSGKSESWKERKLEKKKRELDRDALRKLKEKRNF